MSKNKSIIFSIATLAVISIVVFLSYANLNKKDVVASVGKSRITKTDLNERIYGINFSGDPRNPESVDDGVKKQLIDQLIEEEIIRKKAKELKISATDQEINEKLAREFPDLNTYTDETQKKLIKGNAELKILIEKVKDKVVSWRKGKIVTVRADLHYNAGPTNKDEAERAKLSPEDKKYAQELINSLSSKIKSGQVTFDQAMELANNDQRLGKNAWGTWKLTFSKEFTKQDAFEKSYPNDAPNFWKEINKVPIGKTSDPIAIKVIVENDGFLGKTGDLVEGFYIIVKNEEGNDGEADSYEEWLQKEKGKNKVKIY